MLSARWLLGFVAVTACSVDHVVVAALDDAGGGAGMMNNAAGIGGGGAAPIAANGGSGALAATGGGLLTGGETDRILIASGGNAQSVLIGELGGDAGATSLKRCSCLGQTSQMCGTDGITYPNECGDAEPCVPPAIACWHACPCLDDGVEMTGPDAATTWYTVDCIPTAGCSVGVVCMQFTNAELNDLQTTDCSSFN